MNCPICRFKKISNLEDVNEYHYCSNCKTAWLKKSPKIEYEDKYYKPKSELAKNLFKPISFILYKIRSLYLGLGKKNLWIDVGSGDGAYLSTINANNRIGIEVSNFGKNILEKSGIKMVSPGKFLKTTGLKADAISFWHVVEHLENPSIFLTAAKRNLSSRGKLIIGAPNLDSFEFRIFRRHWFNLFPQFHIWHFSTNSLTLIIERAGLKVVYVDYFAPEHHFASCLQSFINASAKSQNILLELFRRHVNKYSLKLSSLDIFWTIFWTTLGLPAIIMFWLIAAIFHKPSAIVIIAESQK